MSDRARAAVGAWAVLVGTVASAQERAVAARPEDSPGYPPVVEGKPVELTIGCYVLDSARVTAREESFDGTLYFEMAWRDLRALHAPGAPETPGWRRLEPGKVWAPRVEGIVRSETRDARPVEQALRRRARDDRPSVA